MGWIVCVVLAVVAASCESDRPGAGEAPTYNADVAAILDDHCAQCHRTGGVGGFSLRTYEDLTDEPVVAHVVADAIATGIMPPWLPDGTGLPLAGSEIDLSPDDVETVLRWIEAGMPEGQGEPPATRTFESQWPLGEPDIVLQLSDDFIVPATGREIFRNFVVPIDNGSPLLVGAIDILPGEARSVVHHASILVDDTGAARFADASSPEAGFAEMESGFSPGGLFVGWTPGRQPSGLGAGVAWELPAGSDLLLQFHLKPSGEETPLQPKVGIYLTDEPGLPSATLHLSNTSLVLPPDEVTSSPIRSSFRTTSLR